jgi:hypothetical protein
MTRLVVDIAGIISIAYALEKMITSRENELIEDTLSLGTNKPTRPPKLEKMSSAHRR